MRLTGKTALITGSTSGIGLGIAKAFAADGATIIINGFGDAGAIETERKGLEAISGGRAAYDGADLTKPEQIEEMFQRADADFGGVDILVNNAGMQFVSPVEDFPVEKWDMIIALNLTASFHTIRHAVPGMRKKGWGRIIATASAHSLVASPFKSAYVTAKHALEGLSKVIALEGAAHGVTSNCINPGYVRTPLVEAQIADQAAAHGMSEDEVLSKVILASSPVKRLIDPSEVATAAAFLCSPGSDSITGSDLVVDGGWGAR